MHAYNVYPQTFYMLKSAAGLYLFQAKKKKKKIFVKSQSLFQKIDLDYRVAELSGLEGIHEGHQVQILTPNRAT